MNDINIELLRQMKELVEEIGSLKKSISDLKEENAFLIGQINQLSNSLGVQNIQPHVEQVPEAVRKDFI